MKKLLMITALLAASVQAEVYIDGKKVNLEPVDIYLKSSDTVWGCPNPEFHPDDENQDGTLDDLCVGLEYDPCNMEGSLWWAYVQRGQTGEQCQTKQELADDCSVDFSPLPPKCSDLVATPLTPEQCEDIDFSPLPPECS